MVIFTLETLLFFRVLAMGKASAIPAQSMVSYPVIFSCTVETTMKIV